MRTRAEVLRVPIDVIGAREALQAIEDAARSRRSGYVCACNVHVVIVAGDRPGLLEAIRGAMLALPDGAPVAWALRRLGHRAQRRIPGPDLMYALCGRAAEAGLSVFFFGSTDEALEALSAKLRERFPRLQIAGTYSPPFRALTLDEDSDAVKRLNGSKASLVFVGLGCPKQELWMAEHQGRVDAVMIGVGAAFDFHAGTVSRAPAWMQAAGLEWLHRLAAEPRRLGKRYLVTNTVYALRIVVQLVRHRFEEVRRIAE